MSILICQLEINFVTFDVLLVAGGLALIIIEQTCSHLETQIKHVRSISLSVGKPSCRPLVNLKSQWQSLLEALTSSTVILKAKI